MRVSDLKSKLDLPDAEAFTKTLGTASWLMSLSADHKERTLASLEKAVMAPLMLKQLRVFTKDKQPLAFVVWAYASPEVKARINAGERMLSLQDWRSGEEIVVVDCISPFADPAPFIGQFLQDAARVTANA